MHSYYTPAKPTQQITAPNAPIKNKTSYIHIIQLSTAVKQLKF